MKFVVLCTLPDDDTNADWHSLKPSDLITSSGDSKPNSWKLAFLSVRSVGRKMPTDMGDIIDFLGLFFCD